MKDNSFEEQWHKKGDNLVGIGYDLVDGDTVNIEKLSISKENGVWRYGADVSNQNGRKILFDCVEENDKKMIFENQQHDFPQRIVYELKSENELQVRIEKLDGGNAIPFNFKKKE